MDTVSRVLAAITVCVAIICLTVLIALGTSDAITLGVISTLVLQVLNYLSTHTVAKRVNGHMTALIKAKTVPDDATHGHDEESAHE